MTKSANSKSHSAIIGVLAVAVIILLGLVVWYAHQAHEQKQVTVVSSGGCSNASSNTSAQVGSFVDAYNDNGQASLTVVIECGTPSQGGYAATHNLTVNHKVISDSQSSYGDGAPAGPTTTSTCQLSISSSTVAIATCGRDKFNLYSS